MAGLSIGELKDRVRIPVAWMALGLPGEPRKTCKSPFPDDHKHGDRNASFSVFDDGRKWRDFALDETGDVIDLVERAGGMSFDEAVNFVRELAGESRESGGGGKGSGRKGGVRRRAAAPKKAPVEEPRYKAMAMPEDDRNTWKEGVRYLQLDSGMQREIAEWRGWPEEIVNTLAHDGFIGMPRARGRRGVAFPVQYPIRGGWMPIGYHCRHKPRNGQRAAWSFHPRGIPAMPFVLGPFYIARLVVVCEGQFDALTFAIAGGFFDHDAAWPERISVIGIRGASGWRPFLEHWAPYWPASARFLVIAQNDEAGRRWRENLVEELRPRSASVHFMTPAGEGCDFNDAHKVQPFGREDIGRMFLGLGLIDEGGRPV